MTGPGEAPRASEPSGSGENPGLPFLRSWRAVYTLVLGCFVLWVVLLFMLGMLYS